MKKYDDLRSQIRNGDIMLFRGESLLSKQIQEFDDAYYNHTGLVFESNNRLFILDSNVKGVNPEFLSVRIDGYTDFCIIRPFKWDDDTISQAVAACFDKASIPHIKYDVNLLLQIAIYRKTGIRVGIDRENRDICSEFVRRYTRYLAPKPTCYEQPNLPTDFITPWDFIIYANEKEFEVMFDNSERRKYRKP
jgi:hypothetical protein